MTEVDVSVVFSFRNEEKGLSELIRRLQAALLSTGLSYEIIFVNDASTDRSLDVLLQEAKQCFALRIITMRERLGVMPCFIEGFRFSRGAAVVMMDSDLQDPPEILPEMIQRWQSGAEVVYTIRRKRDGESYLKMAVTHGAYRILSHISCIEFPVDAGDFRLLSRKTVDAILAANNPHLYLRGFVPSLQLKQASVYYDREKRFSGTTHFPLYSLDPSGPAATFFTALFNFAAPGRLFLFFMCLFLGIGFLAAAIFKTVCFVFKEPLSWAVSESVFIFCWSTVQAAGLIYLRPRFLTKTDSPKDPASIILSSFGFNIPPETFSRQYESYCHA